MKVTVVTGASSGIGRSLARRLAASGAPVGLLARRLPLLESLAEEIRANGGQAFPVACDATDREQVGAAFAAVSEALGPVERLIANAGGGSTTPIDGFSGQHIDDLLHLNVSTAANCIEAVLPGMLERGRGHLVAVSSPAGFRGLPTAAGYSAAKAALTNLMESLRVELGPRGVDVTTLFPGFVQTRPDAGGASRRKPFRIDVEDCAVVMERAIEARARHVVFPLSIALLIRGASLLPAPVFDRVLGAIAARRG